MRRTSLIAALLVIASVAAGCAQPVRGEALAGPTPSTTPTRAPGSAPFDPCKIVTWADFPLEVRPQVDIAPRHRPPNPQAPDEVFADGCSFDNNELIPFKPFMALVIWGSITKIRVDPKNPADKPMMYGNRRGVQTADVDEKGQKGCVTRFTLDYGQVAGISLTNGRFPEVDPCKVVDGLAEKIVQRLDS
ncbi:DUF3558 domain-containing protein [Allokutzneria sp. A3M-2-11 16]|uniref:DUF3558 family protein n=1 Tax=Allokutzneria sp. A3M-2-11 16 TaxID=2962043 RepID=UPI0020B8B567|nr:DUF3558 family protein [Allokutzneria sp. A3M-2-11 16]MCP3799678.1 DUF3558 domain-containing protein [Allokutzneria sp. A3M-2-11 16]